jgi:shikimate 5-dehydrogenase
MLTNGSKRHAMLVNVTIPHKENLVKAEKDIANKDDLAHEVSSMWDVDSTTIVSENGRATITKSLDQHHTHSRWSGQI